MGGGFSPNADMSRAIAAERALHEAFMQAVAHRPSRAPPAVVKSIDELGQIFESLDSLTELLPQELQSWQKP
eukprot:2638260-Prymnesium_polylepis.1